MSLLPVDWMSFFLGVALTSVIAFAKGFFRKAGAAAFEFLRGRLSANPSDHDQILFMRFQEEVAPEPMLRLFKTPDFDDSIRREDLRPLNRFVEAWAGVDAEFIDPKIEAAKKRLYGKAERLASEISRLTVPVGDGSRVSVYSDNLRNQTGVDARPDEVIQDARTLNDLARPFGQEYESFVRLCRSRLNS